MTSAKVIGSFCIYSYVLYSSICKCALNRPKHEVFCPVLPHLIAHTGPGQWKGRTLVYLHKKPTAGDSVVKLQCLRFREKQSDSLRLWTSTCGDLRIAPFLIECNCSQQIMFVYTTMIFTVRGQVHFLLRPLKQSS